ncbi:hypothetical protein ACJO1Z_09055 [Vibrio parahaemolyticus]|uniref:hypothetical protein n=1 Tax=Vibrio parahaemolyticus TaxID=670 RepID=UPI00387B9CD7
MFVAKVAPENLNTKRLDSDFYRPEYVKIDKVLSQLNCVNLGTVGKFFTGPFGSKLPSNLYLDEGVPLFRVGNVGQFEVLVDNFAYLAPTVHDELKVSEVLPGDLLIVKASVGEKICKVPEWLPKANITQHIIGIRPNGSKDTDFVSAFLFSYYGVGQLQRYSLGSIIQYLGITDAKGVNLYSPDPQVQKYIGDKVRQAEQLRAWAKRLEDAVYRYHSQFIPDQEHLDFSKKTRMVSVKRMTERLDAHFYPGVVEQYLIAHPGKFENVSALTSAIYNGQTQPESSEEFCEQITVAHLSASFVKGQPRKVKVPAKNNKFVKPHDILMCNAAHNKSYIGRDLTYVHTDKELLPSTEVMTIRVDRDQVPASYVRAYLLSRLGYVKIQSTIRGITAHSYPDDVALLDIYIPEVEPSKKEEWFKQDDLLVQAGFAVELAQLLTSSAKNLVEALVEGQLTEQQLIQAQQALDDGDNSLDQAILSKLSNEGCAIDGSTPLFSDLDELYRLLESAAQAEAEE